jgi:hypothetical protein
MEGDKIEKFVLKHREEFDYEVPGDSIWPGIESQLDGHARRKGIRISLVRVAGVAASVLLLIALGIAIGLNLNQDRSGEIRNLMVGDQRWYEIEQFYARQVAEKRGEISQYLAETDLQADLEELDNNYEELKQDLSDAGAFQREEIVHAMIMNYKAKITLLERVLEKLEQHSKKQHNNNEDTEL